MGTICAPSYGNIFMDHFERKFIYPFIKTFSLIYLRFIDDIFFIWTGSKTDLENFLNELNTKHPSIKFEYEISKERISFLDTEIYIKKGKLYTKIFRKKTDRQTFLSINSEHPKSLKNSISYSQALRIKRICSTKKDFDHYSRELRERFLKQGYPQKLVDEQLEKVDKLVRDALLQEKDQEQQDPKRIPLVLTYNRFLPNLTVVVRKNWNILQSNKSLWELFQEQPITRGGSRINFGVLQNFTKKIEHRNDVICRKIIDSARSKKVQF